MLYSFRGEHRSLVVNDEADYTPSLFTNIILPLCNDREMKLIATSSMKSDGKGIFSAAVNATDHNGVPIINSIIVGTVCDSCRAMGLASQCVHYKDLMAAWKSPERVAKTNLIFESINKREIGARETQNEGLVIDESIFARDMYIDIFSIHRAEELSSDELIDTVYIGIDPAFGGKCEFSLTAIASVWNHVTECCSYKIILTCNEKLCNDGVNCNTHILSIIDMSIAGLESNAAIKNRRVPFVFALEANQSDVNFIAPYITEKNNLLPYTKYLVLTEINPNVKPRYGVPKTKNTTTKMIAIVTFVLMAKLLSLHPLFTVVSTPFVPRTDIRAYKQSMLSQFADYITDDNEYHTGKHGGKNDDRIISLMTALYWMVFFCTDSTNIYYLQFKQLHSQVHWVYTTEKAIGEMVCASQK